MLNILISIYSIIFGVWKQNALAWCWFVQRKSLLFQPLLDAVSFWKQHKTKSFGFFCFILDICPVVLKKSLDAWEEFWVLQE